MRRSCDVGVAVLSRGGKPPFGRGVALSIFILFGAACGPAQRANNAGATLPIPPMRTTPPAAVVEKPEPAPAAPKDLELSARVSDPTRLFREILNHLPPALANNIPNAEMVLELGLGSKLAETVDLAQPIDVANIGGESSTLFVSFAVKSEVEPKLGERLPLEERHGLLYVKKDDTTGSFILRSGTCAFVPPSRAAPIRLVCATELGSYEDTARWLAHAAGGEPIDSDLRISLPGSILHDKTSKTKRVLGSATKSKFGDGLVDDFVDEIASLQADLRLGAGTTELTGTLRLDHRKSMLAKTLLLRTTPSPPSPAFYRLPSDSLFALHTTGADATDLAPMRRAFFDELAESLVEDGYLPEKVGAIRTHLETVAFTGGPLVIGAGLAGGLDRAERTLAALDAASGTNGLAAAETSARAALVPWVMIEVEQKPDVVIMSLKGMVKASEEADKTRKPGSATSSLAKKDPDSDHVDVRITTLDPALKLPTGTLALEVIMAPRTKGKHPIRRAKLFVVPKGAATWIGYSEDAAAIALRLRTAIDDTTDSGTLGRSKEATELRAQRGVFTAMTSMAGFSLLVADRTTREDMMRAAQSSARMTALPGRGAGVFAIVGTTEIASPESGPAKLAITARAPRGALTDLVSAVLH